ncbi:MAG: GTP 3',8-cyclase MoaA [Pseudomonadota bacterium]
MVFALTDTLGRPLRDLRISVTDRCNFRCVYCMPREVFDKNYMFLPRRELLSFEEIERLVRVFAERGVRKLRLTGGEPLVRSDLEQLIEQLKRVPGIEDIAITTNASLINAARARKLRDAGLDRVNVSLDALDDDTFKAVNDVDISVQTVLDGIEHCRVAGFENIKVNMVVKRGMNENDVLPMARYFHGTGHILRFIEFMDVGNANGWQRDAVFSAQQIVDTIDAELPLEAVEPNYTGEVAKRWRFRDGGGEIGVIASVTQPFCGDCHRARLSAVGQLYTCLFASLGHDFRSLLRDGSDDDALRDRLDAIWSHRKDRYSEVRASLSGQPIKKVEMSYIGG